MNKLLFSFLFFITVAACKQKPKETILSFNKLKVVLWDMLIAEQLAKSNYNKIASKVKPTFLKDSTTAYYQQVLAIHRIDKRNFYSSIAYYESHPVEFNVLLDSVAAYGQQKRADLYKKKK